MRCILTGIARDGNGNIVPSSTITPFLAGTATATSIYTTLAGAVAVNSVTAGADGSFSFYVDRFDYDRDQCFDIQISKTGWTTWTWYNVDIRDVVLGTYTISADKTVTTNLGYVPKGVIYAPATGKTLTISGTLDAGDYQIFSGAGTVTGLKEVNVAWFGAVGDGVTDDTSAIQSALNCGHTVNFGHNLTYLITATITKASDIIIHGNDSKIISSEALGYLKFYGSADAAIAVTEAVTYQDTEIVAANSFVAGDTVAIIDGTKSSFSTARYSYLRGELLHVTGSSGTAFTCQPTRWSYSSTTYLYVAKVNYINVRIDNLSIENTVARVQPLWIEYGKDVKLDNVHCKGGTHKGVYIDKCYRVDIEGGSYICEAPVTPAAQQYGISIASSYFVTITKADILGTRHAVAIGGGTSIGGGEPAGAGGLPDEIAGVPTYMTTIDGSILKNNSHLYTADIHGCVINTTYKNNKIYGGCAISGLDVTYDHNDVYLEDDNIAFNFLEYLGGDVRITNNYVSAVNGSTTTYNIKIIGTTAISYSACMNVASNVKIYDNTFYLQASHVDIVSLGVVDASTIAHNIDYRGNVYKGDGSGLKSIIKYYRQASAPIPSFIRVHDYYPLSTIVPANLTFIIGLVEGAGVYAGMRVTTPTFTDKVSIAFTTSDYYKSGTLTYPVNRFVSLSGGAISPIVQTTVQNTATCGFDVISSAHTSATSSTIYVSTGEASRNFAASKTAVVGVRYGLDDYIVPAGL